MRNLKRIILSLLLILILALSSAVFSYAAGTETQQYSYSTSSNSGIRDEVCTTLLGTSADAYYTGNYEYDVLSEKSAGEIKSSLTSLMTSTHKTVTSYNDCRDYVFQVDCEQNNTSRATTLYTSHQMTSSEWYPTWSCNREHVWPQSLGGGNTSGGGADLHHIRPAEASVNSSRGNQKFGDYIPEDHVKGDVARICLYVHVRWGSDWGADSITSVFDSVDLLLEWCELDPVDTWEMGRNEVVESIQGNRNVFIDYPEYAWLIFGEEVPTNMTTPSGEANGGASGGSSSGGNTSGSTDGSGDSIDNVTGGESEIKTASISFTDTTQRTSLSTTEQIWENDGVTFTNNKASSSSDIINSSNPVRLYASSSVTIEAPGEISKIEINCSSSDYALALKSSVGSEATVSGTVVTITLTTPATSYSIASLTKQVRATSLTVYYEEAGEDVTPTCEHANTETSTTDATCTEAGSTTVTCNDCGEVISTTEIPKTDHNYVDGVCSVCGSATAADSLNLDGKQFYIATIRSSGNYFYMTNSLGSASTKRYQAVDSGLTSLPTSITSATDANIFVFELNADGTYCIYAYGITDDNKYLGWTSGNSGTFVSKDNALKFTVTLSDNTYTIGFTDGSRYLQLNSTSGNNYFAFYTGTQSGKLSLIPVVSSDCQHTSTTTTTNPATCTEDGSTTVTCDDCGATVSTTSIPATGHKNTTTTTNAATCTEAGSTTVTCDDCGATVSTEVIAALGHDLVYGVCARCGYAESSNSPAASEWTLVTDASSLKAGDTIIIVAKDYEYALGTTQNKNNRAQAGVSKDGNTVTLEDGVQIITLTAGKTDGTFAFYTGEGYLYAASSSSNYLRTETTLSLNSSWKITIAADGTATVIAQGTNTHNTMQYNSSNSLFATYGSASQKAITIYKLEESGSDSSDGVKIHSASMTVGTNLAMNYYVSGYEATDYYMVFTMNGVASEPVYGTEKGGYLVFSFTNIPPQYMGDNISTVLYSSDGSELASYAEFSVKEYALRVMELHSDKAAMMNLIADMLRYGAAAQEYRGYKKDAPVTDGVDLEGLGSFASVTEDDNVRAFENNGEVISFTAVGVRFDFDNKIYVKFTADTLDGISIKVRIEGSEESIDLTANIEDNNGAYILYTNGISSTQFATKYVFEVYSADDTAPAQTLTYSVNSYAYAKHESNNAGLAELVKALYNYGKSSTAYKA